MISLRCYLPIFVFCLLTIVAESARSRLISARRTTRTPIKRNPFLPPPLPPIEEDPFSEFSNDGQEPSRALPSQSMPRLDNRNNFDMFPVAQRPKPRCNKRIRIANGVTRFREKGSFVRFACSHGFTLLGATIAVCLRDQWSEPPPMCVRPGCRRILTPSNGLGRLTYAGAVVAFFCESQYNLEGSPILFCDGTRWNGTEPVCIPKHPPSTTTEVYEWAQPIGESDESWDYNSVDPTTEDTSKHLHLTTTEEIFRTTTNSQTHLPTFSTTLAALNTEKPTTEISTSTEVKVPETTTEQPKPTPLIALSTTLVHKTTSNPVITTTMVPTTQITHQTDPPIITTKQQTTTTLLPTTMEKVVPHETTLSNVPLLVGPKSTTENWREEPFPGPTFPNVDQGFPYEVKTPTPEFIQPLLPISPHKLENEDSHEYYKKVAHLSVIGGIIVGVLGSMLFVGGAATYCWRKNIGIARRSAYEADGRTLSSEANDDFTWMESREYVDSRL